MSRRHCYLHLTKERFDGNDVPWLGIDGNKTYDLRKAAIVPADALFDIVRERFDGIKPYHADYVNKLTQLHVSIKKILNKRPDKGEASLLLCTRDTCGNNAAFWRWNHRGYTSDIRAAQIFIYDPDRLVSDREIDIHVPVSAAYKYAEFRVDIQDLNSKEKRNIPHTLDCNFFEEK